LQADKGVHSLRTTQCTPTFTQFWYVNISQHRPDIDSTRVAESPALPCLTGCISNQLLEILGDRAVGRQRRACAAHPSATFRQFWFVNIAQHRPDIESTRVAESPVLPCLTCCITNQLLEILGDRAVGRQRCACAAHPSAIFRQFWFVNIAQHRTDIESTRVAQAPALPCLTNCISNQLLEMLGDPVAGRQRRAFAAYHAVHPNIQAVLVREYLPTQT
jgi:hypothetical protein